jgi:zinc D-Ala-D-Ala carboxypeptidase
VNKSKNSWFPRILSRKKLVIAMLFVVVAALVVFLELTDTNPPTVTNNTTIPDTQQITEEPPEAQESNIEPTTQQPAVEASEVSKWPVTYSSDDAASITVVVNKKHRLPSDYAPSLQSLSGGQLRPEAANALSSLLSAADAEGVGMRIISSYRSYATQVSTYQNWVNQDGQAQADRSSARAGHSEHQTGLAVDLGTPDATCDLDICFGATAQGKWLASNAASYGFIIRYKSDTESITGYQYEPWHLRYVGVDIAQAVESSGKTLDEYYGVEAGGY